jgi:hypothetical protein
MNGVISKKKIHYAPRPALLEYLRQHERLVPTPLSHVDLLRFEATLPQRDRDGKETLWETVLYPRLDKEEIHAQLKRIYALLKTGGDLEVMEHLQVERIDFCAFGNSKPFRVKIVNSFNDNHDYFYIKVPDASRVYGLELEHILSPNRISYLVDESTLVEEHIPGVPGDHFIHRHMPEFKGTRIAKEFVKFNERCFTRLLGDMRAYNFVVDMTRDFDGTQFRFRAIDFDQQCYEGAKSLYMPRSFQENVPYVELCLRLLNKEAARQYQQEERSLMARRVRSSRHRLNSLLGVLVEDEVSLPEKKDILREALARHYEHPAFLQCQTMGEVVKESLRMLLPAAERTRILP